LIFKKIFQYGVKSNKKFPSILFNAIPKSAGQYINTTLLECLNFKHTDITVGTFPGDIIDYKRVSNFISVNTLAHHHLEANDINIWYLKKFNFKFVIHIRDPRACVYSWTHHINQATYKNKFLPHPIIAPKKNYFNMNIQSQIDWHLSNSFKYFVNFIERWVNIKKKFSDKILITTYDNFISDEQKFYSDILNFYEIDKDIFKFKQLPKVKSNNFRSGKVDSWRKIFSKNNMKNQLELYQKNFLKCLDGNIKIKNAAQF